jgi:hypothetical protein
MQARGVVQRMLLLLLQGNTQQVVVLAQPSCGSECCWRCCGYWWISTWLLYVADMLGKWCTCHTLCVVLLHVPCLLMLKRHVGPATQT